MRICCVDKITQTFYVDIDCLDLLLVAAAWVASTVLKGTLGVRTCCGFFKGNWPVYMLVGGGCGGEEDFFIVSSKTVCSSSDFFCSLKLIGFEKVK